jgi:phosphoribosylformylglycinamidine (FGAM) synthase-like enzyme
VLDYAELFSESPSRVVICTPDPETLMAQAEAAGVSWSQLGRAEGDRLVVEGLVDLSLEELSGAWRDVVPRAMATGTR